MPPTPHPLPARLWLRVDATDPLMCSVRFSLDRGEGFLVWNGATGGGGHHAVRTGTAGGLSHHDLPSLALMVRADAAVDWVRHPLRPRFPTDLSRLALGQWEALREVTDPTALSTDLVFSLDILDSSAPAASPEVAVVEEEPSAPVEEVFDERDTDFSVSPDEPSELEESITDFGQVATSAAADGSSTRPGASGSTLVRSLVKRIRVQDTELRALRKRVTELEAMVARSKP